MKKNLLALLLVLTMICTLFAGCGGTQTSSASSAPEPGSITEAPEAPPEEPAAPEPAGSTEESSAPEDSEPDQLDFTESNANMDFTGFQEMLKTLTTELPVVDEPETLTYFFGYESSVLNYLPGGELKNHQIWSALEDMTGVHLELNVVDSSTATDKLNLMLASGDYTDLMNMSSYTSGVDAAYEQEIILDLGDKLEENMPNYWTIIHSDQKLLGEVQDSDKFLAIYPIKDEVANPQDMGPFVRMDWLEDLDMEVPTTYDELTAVLEAFKTEKNCAEPMSLYNTVSMNDGLLMGGFGSMAELSTNGLSGNALNGYYQEDGHVIYGATADGTRKFLSWLHMLYEKGLIDF